MDGPISSTPTDEIVCATMDRAPPVVVRDPVRQTTPLVFASPHSGRDYPVEFAAVARLDGRALRRSEDSFVDDLFADAPRHGAPLLCATFPRAFCDPNREAWELDPAMFEDALPSWVNTASPRVAAGLGTIPRVVASGEAIYAGKLRFSEAERRVRDYWQPYHTRLAALIGETSRLFGACLLVDCHSMPVQNAAGGTGRPAADFILGDAHGTTCAPRITRFVERSLTGMGYVVRRNDPYAGGFVTRHYGRPREHVHALQVEIARSLYMNEQRIEPTEAFAVLRRSIDGLIAALAEQAATLLA